MSRREDGILILVEVVETIGVEIAQQAARKNDQECGGYEATIACNLPDVLSCSAFGAASFEISRV